MVTNPIDTNPADHVPSDMVGSDAISSETALSSEPSDADIDAVMDDPTMSTEEKLARLEELRERVTHQDGEEFAPFSTRIMDAFSMLAQGGHEYADTLLDDEPKA